MGMRGSAAYIFIVFILYVYIYSYVHKIQCPDPSQWPAQASGAAHTRMYRYKLLGPPPSWGRPPYVHAALLCTPSLHTASPPRGASCGLRSAQSQCPRVCGHRTRPTGGLTQQQAPHWCTTPRQGPHQWETTGAESTHTPSMGESSPSAGPAPRGKAPPPT
uniref:Uncharacterized protein n=1 Tax=Ixodes ricinus TaxID=34613 RepID=A0A6B0UX05_IXORI